MREPGPDQVDDRERRKALRILRGLRIFTIIALVMSGLQLIGHLVTASLHDQPAWWKLYVVVVKGGVVALLLAALYQLRSHPFRWLAATAALKTIEVPIRAQVMAHQQYLLIYVAFFWIAAAFGGVLAMRLRRNPDLLAAPNPRRNGSRVGRRRRRGVGALPR